MCNSNYFAIEIFLIGLLIILIILTYVLNSCNKGLDDGSSCFSSSDFFIGVFDEDPDSDADNAS